MINSDTSLIPDGFCFLDPLEELSTGPLQKLFHYAIFQKFFHIFVHKWSMFNHTCNLIIMSFYFYKSYQRIMKQHLYINI